MYLTSHLSIPMLKICSLAMFTMFKIIYMVYLYTYIHTYFFSKKKREKQSKELLISDY